MLKRVHGFAGWGLAVWWGSGVLYITPCLLRSKSTEKDLFCLCKGPPCSGSLRCYAKLFSTGVLLILGLTWPRFRGSSPQGLTPIVTPVRHLGVCYLNSWFSAINMLLILIYKFGKLFLHIILFPRTLLFTRCSHSSNCY